MKTLRYVFSAGVLMSVLCAVLVACNDANGSELSDEQRRIEQAKLTDDVYYVAGSYAQEVVIQDDGTAKCGAYLFISENLQDTVCVYNHLKDQYLPGKLFDGIFEFPAEIMPSTAMCGFYLFPDEYRYLYPVEINSHRAMKEDETLSPLCLALYAPSDLYPNRYIVVESLSPIK